MNAARIDFGFAITAILLCSGCLPGKQLSVLQLSDGRIEFRAEKSGDAAVKRCLASLEIFEVVGGYEGKRLAEPVWSVRSQTGCVDRLTYPKASRNFVSVRRGPLRSNQTYDAIALIDDGSLGVASKRFVFIQRQSNK